jgi:hypothetical protein
MMRGYIGQSAEGGKPWRPWVDAPMGPPGSRELIWFESTRAQAASVVRARARQKDVAEGAIIG